MAFSSEDQAAVEQAMRDLATGQRVVRMTVAGKTMEFGQADMNALRSLHAQIGEALSAADPAPSYILTRSAKGL